MSNRMKIKEEIKRCRMTAGFCNGYQDIDENRAKKQRLLEEVTMSWHAMTVNGAPLVSDLYEPEELEVFPDLPSWAHLVEVNLEIRESKNTWSQLFYRKIACPHQAATA